MVVDLEYRLSSGLISFAPPHGQGTRGCHTLQLGRSAQARTPGHGKLSRQSFSTARRILANRGPEAIWTAMRADANRSEAHGPLSTKRGQTHGCFASEFSWNELG
jgi:hypothetical protein